MKSVTELRKYQYDYHTKLYPYLNDWKRNPYTWLKARFYMETSAILVYFLLKTKIKPNTVTIVYGLLGIIGGILLGISKNPTVIIAIAIFFLKGILDWSDGHLARVTGQTSITGYVLDVYGALLNDLGFQIGLGFYVAFKTGNPIFYYMIFLIPFFYAVNLKSFSQAVLF
ncbi:MAG: CDP-alcohol phosphatidyltransferase family protein, partial [Candidatus Omnitrophica bacterium]|nr:CDP-alcohol phosphatidyltransferase family protein [Candidatus Omnitrophota bacterium]